MSLEPVAARHGCDSRFGMAGLDCYAQFPVMNSLPPLSWSPPLDRTKREVLALYIITGSSRTPTMTLSP